MSIQYWTTGTEVGSGEMWIVEGNRTATDNVNLQHFTTNTTTGQRENLVEEGSPWTIDDFQVVADRPFMTPEEWSREYIADFNTVTSAVPNREITANTIRNACEELDRYGYLNDYSFIQLPDLSLDMPSLINKVSWGNMMKLYEQGVLSEKYITKMFNYVEGEWKEQDDKDVTNKVFDVLRGIKK